MEKRRGCGQRLQQGLETLGGLEFPLVVVGTLKKRGLEDRPGGSEGMWDGVFVCVDKREVGYHLR